jgi:hypothetical protein
MDTPLVSVKGLLCFGLPAIGLVVFGGFAVADKALGAVLTRWRGQPLPSVVALQSESPKSQWAFTEDRLLSENWLHRVGVKMWGVLAFAVMLIVNVTLTVQDRRSLIPSMMAKTFCIVLIPSTLIYINRLLEDWLVCVMNFVQLDAATIMRRFGRPIEKLFVETRHLAVGLVGGIAILLYEAHDNAFTHLTPWGCLIVVAASLIMTGLAGIALVVMVKGAIVVKELGQVPFHLSASPYGIRRTGRLMVRGFLAATLVLVFAVSTMILRPNGHDLVAWSWPLSVTTLYIVMFLLPQWRIHLCMVDFKRKQSLGIEAQIQQSHASFDQRPDKPTADMVDALRKRRDEIEALPEWPFSGMNLSTILGLTVSGPVVALVKSLWAAVPWPIFLEMFRVWIPAWLRAASPAAL